MKESELCKDMPSHYAACLHADCPCAESCLHQLVYQPLMEKEAVSTLSVLFAVPKISRVSIIAMQSRCVMRSVLKA